MRWIRLFLLGLWGVAAGTGWADEVIPANDEARVSRQGAWQWTAHRYAASQGLLTTEDGASLELVCRGRGLVLCLDTLSPPNRFSPRKGEPERGLLEIFVDGVRTRLVRPREEDREVVLFRAAESKERRVRVVHRRDGDGVGARISGFRVLAEPTGDLAFVVSGEHNDALRDVRVRLTRQGRVVREGLYRNWLTGQCRLAGLPPGRDYVLEVQASGWSPWRVENVAIEADRETSLTAAYLDRPWDARMETFKFPHLGYPAIRQAGDGLRLRFEGHRADIRQVRLVRRQGPATISRVAAFTEDKGAAYYYHREGELRLPPDIPPGVYDIEVDLRAGDALQQVVSRRSVAVVEQYPQDPVFMTFGHLDTWGQYQAEYLARLVELANLLAPDMMLVSNEVNPAYVAGALYQLELPFVVNFGNHRGPEPGPWFGEQVGVVDFGPNLSVLNFGRPWDLGVADAEALLAARAHVPVKVINAFEPNAPVETLLDRHRIALIHEAHGPGLKVDQLGATPTLRVGKVNSASFRLVRFRGHRPVSATYRGHATEPIPFRRDGPAPVRVSYSPANDGTQAVVTAQLENDLEEDLPSVRMVFVLPAGRYTVNGGRAESAVSSDDGRFTVLTVRRDLAAKQSARVEVRPL